MLGDLAADKAVSPAVRPVLTGFPARSGRKCRLQRYPFGPGAPLIQRRHGLSPTAGGITSFPWAQLDLHQFLSFHKGGGGNFGPYRRRGSECRGCAGGRRGGGYIALCLGRVVRADRGADHTQGCVGEKTSARVLQWISRCSFLSSRMRALAELFLNLSQALLTEEHLIAHEESRDAEGAARSGGLRVGREFRLDGGVLSGLEDGLGVETRGAEHGGDHGRIVHLLSLFPHRLEDCFEVDLACLCAPGGQQAAHDQERIDWEIRIEAKGAEVVLGDEALCFEALVFQFTLHVAEGSHWSLVPRQLEQTAEQAGNEIHVRVGSGRDAGQNLPGEIGVRAGEVENKIDRLAHEFALTSALSRDAGPTRVSMPSVAVHAARRSWRQFGRALGSGHRIIKFPHRRDWSA